jgi:hypothetical protein
MFFSCSVFFKWLLRWAINVCKAGASLDELAVLEGDIKAALSRVSKEKERILKEKLFVSVHNCSTKDRDYSNVFFLFFSQLAFSANLYVGYGTVPFLFVSILHV